MQILRTLDQWEWRYIDQNGQPAQQPVTVPHAWRQSVDVRWEGPAIYRTKLALPNSAHLWLVFEGVSYAAEVRINGDIIGTHHGIWDSFAFPITQFCGETVEIEVSVIKNGGGTFPVNEVASGFIPFVFHTFGGIFKPVRLVNCEQNPTHARKQIPNSNLKVNRSVISVNDKPFFVRGVLSWGWYPDLQHQNPDTLTISKEIQIAKSFGFNLIKFCLWMPPHEYLEKMAEAGLFAWIELPLWDPSPDSKIQNIIFDELERAVLQYAHHSNILIWTCGCELSSNCTPDFRKKIYQMVYEHTHCPLLKDNSGSSEMYGGDPLEFGSFYDFHPYCDTEFYPEVLLSLSAGARSEKPILLGEFNDYDVHRDLNRISTEQPYWASQHPVLNDQGVRWQHDLPRFLSDESWRHAEILPGSQISTEISIDKSNFIRKFVQESVASQPDLSGFVITGWRDTPISTSGVVDDWGEPKQGLDFSSWNTDTVFFLVPRRRPPWIHGGNRQGWQDSYNFYEGNVHFLIGTRSALASFEAEILVTDSFGKVVFEKAIEVSVSSGKPESIEELRLPQLGVGVYSLSIKSTSSQNRWKFFVYPKHDVEQVLEGWKIWDPENRLRIGNKAIKLDKPSAGGIVEMHSQLGNKLIFLEQSPELRYEPFWRECLQTSVTNYDLSAFQPITWEKLMAISTDRTLPSEFVNSSDVEPLITRLDTRTYNLSHYAVLQRTGETRRLITTLRPYGGLGIQPHGLPENPAGLELIQNLLKILT